MLVPDAVGLTVLVQGGMIGGTKFIAHGILFKVESVSSLLTIFPSLTRAPQLANDHSNFFRSDDATAKIAGHELKCLTAIFNATAVHHLDLALPMVSAQLSGHAPLISHNHTHQICLIDYLGYRLIALAVCPLSPETLLLGSADAAVHIVSGRDPAAEEKLMLLSKHLNLKPHVIRGHRIPLAVDCELHKVRLTCFFSAAPHQHTRVFRRALTAGFT